MTRNTAAVASLLLSLAGPCSHAASVRDDLGQEVWLARAAQRIVTLSPHATELVLAAGAGGRLAGISAGGTPPGSLCALPRIGGPGALDREALLASSPDLVIAWQSGNRASDLDWIVGSGIALYRSEPRSLQDIADSMRHIGILSGTQAAAEDSARLFESSVRTPCEKLPPKPVYLAIWERPAMTVGGRHWINSVLEAAGYRNVYAHIDRSVFVVTPEAAHAYADLSHISLIRSFDDSVNDRLAGILSRPGPGLADAVQLLCARRMRQGSAGGD